MKVPYDGSIRVLTYLEVAISQFRSAKNSYITNIQLFFPNSQFQLNADFLSLLANTLLVDGNY